MADVGGQMPKSPENQFRNGFEKFLSRTEGGDSESCICCGNDKLSYIAKWQF